MLLSKGKLKQMKGSDWSGIFDPTPYLERAMLIGNKGIFPYFPSNPSPMIGWKQE